MAESEYQKERAQMAEKAAKAAKSSGSKVLASIAKEEKRKGDKNAQMMCRLAEQVFHESLDMYKDGEMEWPEMVKDLTAALNAIK